MSKEFKNIDELFKAELGGTTAKAPAHVKANIDKAVGFGAGKKLLWFLLPLLLVAIATPLLYNHFTSEAEIAVNNITETANSSSSVNENESVSSTSVDNNQIENNQSSNNEYTSNISQTSNSSINDGNSTPNSNINFRHDLKTNQKTDNSNDLKVLKDEKTELVENSLKNNKDKSDLTVTNPKIEKDKDEKTNTNTNDLKIDTKDVLKDDEIVNNQKDDIILSSNLPNKADSVVVDNGLKTFDTKPATDTSEIDSDNLVDNNDKPNLDSLSNNDSANNDIIVDKDTTAIQPDVNIDPPTDPYSPWFLTATAGINIKKSNIIVPTTGDTTSSYHNVNDKMGHSGQIEIAYRLKNSLTFGTGIGYTSLLETYTYYKSENVLTDTTYTWVYTQDSIQDSLGVWTVWQDSSQTESYEYSDQEVYNANGTNINTYLNIPLSIGTNLDFGKLKLDLFAQGRFNLLLRSRTTYVENDQIIIVPKGSFKNSYFDLILGANLHYNVFGNIYLTGTVRYKPPTSKIYYPSVTNRFQNVHVGVGFSLNF